MTEYRVITEGSPNEVWASGFYGDEGKEKAERMVAADYWHRLMIAADKSKRLAVVPKEKRAA